MRWAAAIRRARGKKSSVSTMPLRLRASSATEIVSRTVSSGNRVAAWNDRPRPLRARIAGARSLTSSPNNSTRPDEGTYPPMAFISVVLPAPFVPIRPTISFRRTSIETRSLAHTPPKVTTMSSASSIDVGRVGAHARRAGSTTVRPLPASRREAASIRGCGRSIHGSGTRCWRGRRGSRAAAPAGRGSM